MNEITQYQTDILTNTNHIATSTKYIQIPTQDIIDRFASHGFTLSTMQQAGFRKEEKYGKVKHIVRMKAPNELNSPIAREVVIMNSSDSSSSLRLNFGAIRAACLNQLVFGDLLVPEEKIKHTTKDPFNRIDAFADTVQSSLHDEYKLRQAMINQRLSMYDISRIAEFTASLREDTPILDHMELARVNRIEDQAKNLFVVYNRIQENLIKGNYRKVFTNKHPDTGEDIQVIKKTKLLTDRSKLITVNKKLHEYCAEMVL